MSPARKKKRTPGSTTPKKTRSKAAPKRGASKRAPAKATHTKGKAARPKPKPNARPRPKPTARPKPKPKTRPKPKPTARPKPKPALKATVPKAKAARPLAAKAAGMPARAGRQETAGKPTPAQRSASKRIARKRARSAAAAAAAVRSLPPRTPLAGEPSAKLGAKWACFECGAKFYDLNRPEPLCPKCGANQHERPLNEPKDKTAAEATPRRRARPMAPLLDDEEEHVAVEEDEIGPGPPAGEQPETFIDDASASGTEDEESR